MQETNLDMTFHRAFDMARDMEKALKDIEQIGGFSAVLTSGQEKDAESGLQNLKKLLTLAGEQLAIMPGGGIHSENLKQLDDELHAPAYHMSGKTAAASRMQYRNARVRMGEDSGSEYTVWRTDEAEIRRAKAILT